MSNDPVEMMKRFLSEAEFFPELFDVKISVNPDGNIIKCFSYKNTSLSTQSKHGNGIGKEAELKQDIISVCKLFKQVNLLK